MIVSVTSLKGGVGKSTISQNIAVCFAHMGYRTAIIDADTNDSSERWSGLREEEYPSVTVVSIKDAKALQKNIKSLHEDYEMIVIDGTPSMDKLVSTIMLLGDIVLIPIRPSGMDIWATEKFLEKYEDAKVLKEDIPAYFVLNQFNDRNLFSKESKDVLADLEIGMMKSTIKSRQAYVEAVVQGMGVYEYKDAKAKEEVISLANEIISVLQKLHS